MPGGRRALCVDYDDWKHCPIFKYHHYSAGIAFRRQILTSKVHLRTVRENIFISAVDPLHRYSNESERANKDIVDGLKLKKPLFAMVAKIFSAH